MVDLMFIAFGFVIAGVGAWCAAVGAQCGWEDGWRGWNAAAGWLFLVLGGFAMMLVGLAAVSTHWPEYYYSGEPRVIHVLPYPTPQR